MDVDFLKAPMQQGHHDNAKPLKRVPVFLTGNLADGVKKESVKLCVLALVPFDDVAIRHAVNAWNVEVDFNNKIGRIHALSQQSLLYDYHSMKVPPNTLTELCAPGSTSKDFDIIMRPANDKGAIMTDCVYC